MAATLRATILPYKSSFVPLDLSTVKLKQDFIGGSSKDKKCHVLLQWQTLHGIEALLCVKEPFRRIATRTLLWTTGLALFNGFEEVLLLTLY
jgi:hypothetical protein